MRRLAFFVLSLLIVFACKKRRAVENPPAPPPADAPAASAGSAETTEAEAAFEKIADLPKSDGTKLKSKDLKLIPDTIGPQNVVVITATAAEGSAFQQLTICKVANPKDCHFGESNPRQFTNAYTETNPQSEALIVQVRSCVEPFQAIVPTDNCGPWIVERTTVKTNPPSELDTALAEKDKDLLDLQKQCQDWLDDMAAFKKLPDADERIRTLASNATVLYSGSSCSNLMIAWGGPLGDGLAGGTTSGGTTVTVTDTDGSITVVGPNVHPGTGDPAPTGPVMTNLSSDQILALTSAAEEPTVANGLVTFSPTMDAKAFSQEVIYCRQHVSDQNVCADQQNLQILDSDSNSVQVPIPEGETWIFQARSCIPQNTVPDNGNNCGRWTTKTVTRPAGTTFPPLQEPPAFAIMIGSAHTSNAIAWIVRPNGAFTGDKVRVGTCDIPEEGQATCTAPNIPDDGVMTAEKFRKDGYNLDVPAGPGILVVAQACFFAASGQEVCGPFSSPEKVTRPTATTVAGSGGEGDDTSSGNADGKKAAAWMLGLGSTAFVLSGVAGALYYLGARGHAALELESNERLKEAIRRHYVISGEVLEIETVERIGGDTYRITERGGATFHFDAEGGTFVRNKQMTYFPIEYEERLLAGWDGKGEGKGKGMTSRDLEAATLSKRAKLPVTFVPGSEGASDRFVLMTADGPYEHIPKQNVEVSGDVEFSRKGKEPITVSDVPSTVGTTSQLLGRYQKPVSKPVSFKGGFKPFQASAKAKLAELGANLGKRIPPRVVEMMHNPVEFKVRGTQRATTGGIIAMAGLAGMGVLFGFIAAVVGGVSGGVGLTDGPNLVTRLSNRAHGIQATVDRIAARNRQIDALIAASPTP